MNEDTFTISLFFIFLGLIWLYLSNRALNIENQSKNSNYKKLLTKENSFSIVVLIVGSVIFVISFFIPNDPLFI